MDASLQMKKKNTPLSWIPKRLIKRGLGEIATLRLTDGGIHDRSRKGNNTVISSTLKFGNYCIRLKLQKQASNISPVVCVSGS